MRNAILTLCLLLISIKNFPQGNYCSRGTVEDVSNETYLSIKLKNIKNLQDLIIEIDSKLSRHYNELLEKNERFSKEKYPNLECIVEGVCGVPTSSHC